MYKVRKFIFCPRCRYISIKICDRDEHFTHTHDGKTYKRYETTQFEVSTLIEGSERYKADRYNWENGTHAELQIQQRTDEDK